MSRRTLTLDDRLHDYVIERGVREHPALAALREATRTIRAPACRSAPSRGNCWRCWSR